MVFADERVSAGSLFTHKRSHSMFHDIRRKCLKAFTALLLGSLSVGVAQAQDALVNIEKNKLIKIAVPTDFAPYGFVGPDLVPQGLDVDMAKYIASQLGVMVELIPVTTANRIPYLQTGRADLVISTLGKNPERAKVIDFTHAYSPFFQGVFGPKSMSLSSPAGLAGKTIGVTRGAIEDMELTKIAPASAQIRRFEDNSATVSAYVSGQVQLIATGVPVAENVMKRNPQLNTEYKLLLIDSPNFIGVAKGQEALRSRVNQIIETATTNGEIDLLAQKWLNRPAGKLPKS